MRGETGTRGGKIRRGGGAVQPSAGLSRRGRSVGAPGWSLALERERQRHTLEPERRADPVLQVALVRRLAALRVVAEEGEDGRRVAHLRGVLDLDVLPSPRRRVLRLHGGL